MHSSVVPRCHVPTTSLSSCRQGVSTISMRRSYSYLRAPSLLRWQVGMKRWLTRALGLSKARPCSALDVLAQISLSGNVPCMCESDELDLICSALMMLSSFQGFEWAYQHVVREKMWDILRAHSADSTEVCACKLKGALTVLGHVGWLGTLASDVEDAPQAVQFLMQTLITQVHEVMDSPTGNLDVGKAALEGLKRLACDDMAAEQELRPLHDRFEVVRRQRTRRRPRAQ
eukprot:m.162778 g.162778  ORF g.162778 m.162778 type:complete len:230 (-) comp10303_c3_seq1:16-705(-)